MDDYSILGVSRSDPIEIITQKYKKLAKKYHPDRNINNKIVSEEKFKEISSAYHNIVNKKSNPFGTFTPNMNGQFDFTHIFSKINNMKDFLKNTDYEHLINNVINKVEIFNEFMDSKKNNLIYTEDLYINANIELFDIYNNIEKTINIERLRKCDTCNVGVKEHCSECNSMKFINKNVELIFECKLKNIIFHKLSHHNQHKTPGNIIININPKNNSFYNIYNNYDLIYNYNIELTNNLDIIVSFKHLDNKTYSFKIDNPQLNYNYKIPNLGLLYNSDQYKRGDLYIILISQKKYNTQIKIL